MVHVVVLLGKQPGLPGNAPDHRDGNAITTSQQIPNHSTLMLKVSHFTVVNFKDAAQIILINHSHLYSM